MIVNLECVGEPLDSDESFSWPPDNFISDFNINSPPKLLKVKTRGDE